MRLNLLFRGCYSGYSIGLQVMNIGYKAWIRRKHQTATIGCLSGFGLLIFWYGKK